MISYHEHGCEPAPLHVIDAPEAWTPSSDAGGWLGAFSSPSNVRRPSQKEQSRQLSRKIGDPSHEAFSSRAVSVVLGLFIFVRFVVSVIGKPR